MSTIVDTFYFQAGVIILIAGLIGYLTNKVAVKMLFRPIKPIRILFFKFQGLIPKRKDQIGTSIAKTIKEEFITEEDILSKLVDIDQLKSMKESIGIKIKSKIVNEIPPMIKMMAGGAINEMIDSFIANEGDNLILDFVNEFKSNGIEKLNIENLVKEKIDNLDILEFEKLVKAIVKKELKQIERVGLQLGLVIGIIQSIYLYFANFA